MSFKTGISPNNLLNYPIMFSSGVRSDVFTSECDVFLRITVTLDSLSTHISKACMDGHTVMIISKYMLLIRNRKREILTVEYEHRNQIKHQ